MQLKNKQAIIVSSSVSRRGKRESEQTRLDVWLARIQTPNRHQNFSDGPRLSC